MKNHVSRTITRYLTNCIGQAYKMDPEARNEFLEQFKESKRQFEQLITLYEKANRVLYHVTLHGVGLYYDEINDVIYNNEEGTSQSKKEHFEPEELDEIIDQVKRQKLAKKS